MQNIKSTKLKEFFKVFLESICDSIESLEFPVAG